MKKILITGASGFIGRNVLNFLRSEEWEVHAFSRKSSEDRIPNGYWHQADLLDSAASIKFLKEHNPSHLLHLAWFHEGHSYWTSPENERWMQASEALVRKFLDCGGRRVVIAGTCAEDFVPLSAYGRAKAKLFERARGHCSNTQATFAWGKIFFPYGPLQDKTRLIPSILESLLKGGTAQCKFPALVRDYIFVEDVAKAFCNLLTNSVEGKVDIGTGIGRSLGEIATTAAEIAGYPGKIEFGSQASADPPSVVADPRRLKELGLELCTDLCTGIRRTIAQ